MLFNGDNFTRHHHGEAPASFSVEFASEEASLDMLDRSENENKEVDSMGTKEWAQKRLEEEKKRQEERATEYADFLKLPKGTTRLELLDEEPRSLEGKYGPQTVFKVRRDGKVFDWAINNRNFSLLRSLAQLMADDVKAVSVTRVGEGMDTIYEVTEA